MADELNTQINKELCCMIGESGGGLYMLDRELGKRAFHSELNGEE